MSGIRIVTKSECPFCSMAKNWLKEHSFEYVEDLIDNEEVIRKLGEQILNGDGRAMSLYFGYRYGKPKESVDISSTDGFNINFNDIIKFK